MKTDVANMNHLSSDVLALQQEIEYRNKLLAKKGVVVTNKSQGVETMELQTPAEPAKEVASPSHQVRGEDYDAHKPDGAEAEYSSGGNEATTHAGDDPEGQAYEA